MNTVEKLESLLARVQARAAEPRVRMPEAILARSVGANAPGMAEQLADPVVAEHAQPLEDQAAPVSAPPVSAEMPVSASPHSEPEMEVTEIEAEEPSSPDLEVVVEDEGAVELEVEDPPPASAARHTSAAPPASVRVPAAAAELANEASEVPTQVGPFDAVAAKALASVVPDKLAETSEGVSVVDEARPATAPPPAPVAESVRPVTAPPPASAAPESLPSLISGPPNSMEATVVGAVIPPAARRPASVPPVAAAPVAAAPVAAAPVLEASPEIVTAPLAAHTDVAKASGAPRAVVADTFGALLDASLSL